MSAAVPLRRPVPPSVVTRLDRMQSLHRAIDNLRAIREDCAEVVLRGGPRLDVARRMVVEADVQIMEAEAAFWSEVAVLKAQGWLAGGQA